MVERVRHLETLTDNFYDVTKPVTQQEDTEATDLAIDHFVEAIEEQCRAAFHKGWNGWNREDLCPVPHLIDKMKKAFGEGDVIKVGVYLMMIYGRGVENFEAVKIRTRLVEIDKEIETLISAEEIMCRLHPDNSSTLAELRRTMVVLDEERKWLLKQLG